MTTITATEARNHLPEALNQVAYGGERILIERRGKIIGALISKRDLELLERLEDRYWAETALDGLGEMKAAGEKPISLEKVKANLGL